MLTGLNHITLVVTDLNRSLDFYQTVLGARLAAHWPKGAYLEIGPVWLCLELGDSVSPRVDHSHIAFSCAAGDFDALAERITGAARIWKTNRSEGASVYFEDPDGHKLELHEGTLATRLAHYRSSPASGVTIL